jgi:hypothetical protein
MRWVRRVGSSLALSPHATCVLLLQTLPVLNRLGVWNVRGGHVWFAHLGHDDDKTFDMVMAGTSFHTPLGAGVWNRLARMSPEC